MMGAELFCLAVIIAATWRLVVEFWRIGRGLWSDKE